VTGNPDIYTYELTAEDDFIIMGCDGIWETKSNQQMVDYLYEKLRTKKDLKQIVRDLLEDIISPDYQQTSKL
jgi:serine/threonine protein phosphatase PrpC